MRETLSLTQSFVVKGLQFNGIFRALQDGSATSDALFSVVENNHSFFIIWCPASDRADGITLPDPFALLWIKMDFQVAQLPRKLQVFLER
jgi:hypothetical protein